MSITQNPNRKSVVLKEMLPDERQRMRERFGKAMERKSIIWVPIDGVPLTIHEFASLLDHVTENDNPNEMEAKIDVG